MSEDVKKSKIILDSKDEPLDTSVIYPNEHFTYVGRVYVKKTNNDWKRDEQGNLMFNKVVLPDGHLVNSTQVPGKEWDEFYELEIIKTDTPDVLQRHGRPLTTQIIPHGPIDAKDLFKYDSEDIRYENMDLRDLVLRKVGNKIVKASGEVKKSRHSKELGYWK